MGRFSSQCDQWISSFANYHRDVLEYYLHVDKKFFSPTHRSIADSLNAFSTWAYLFCFTNTEWTIQWDWLKLLDIFGYFVIIIGSLMYNELLIVHVADLDQDIIEKIADRAEKDTIAASSMVWIVAPEETYGNEIMTNKENDVI